MDALGGLFKGSIGERQNQQEIKKNEELSKKLEESEAQRTHKNFGTDSTIFTENTKKLLKLNNE